MEWIGDLVELVKEVGYSGAFSLLTIILVIYILSSFSKRLKSLTDAISILTDKVSSPYLDTERTLDLFRSLMFHTVYSKIRFLGSILEVNNLHTREPQIKANIESEFKTIIAKEAEKMSKYKSVCGDIGKTLEDFIDWPTLLDAIYKIFFSQYPDKQKITDIKIVLNRMVDKIAKILEANGVRN